MYSGQGLWPWLQWRAKCTIFQAMPLDSKHTEASFQVKFDKFVVLTTHIGDQISRFGDIFVDDNCKDDNDTNAHASRVITHTDDHYHSPPALGGEGTTNWFGGA